MDAAAARAKYGRLIEATVGDGAAAIVLTFRPLAADEATDLARRMQLAPELAFDLALDACADACLSDRDSYRAAAEQYPLAFAADDGVCGRLLADADADARAVVRAGIQRWKRAEKNLGAQADSLLALLTYRGGEVSEKQLAGALHLAQALETLPALFRLHLSFFKALSRR